MGARERNEALTPPIGMDFEHIILSERSQMQKSPGYVMPLLGNVQNGQIREPLVGSGLAEVTA